MTNVRIRHANRQATRDRQLVTLQYRSRNGEIVVQPAVKANR